MGNHSSLYPAVNAPSPIRLAGCMSVPRQGYLDCLDQSMGVLQQSHAPLFMGFGVFWHHALSRSIDKALASGHFDMILSLDYDVFATFPMLAQLVCLLYDNPEVDILVPLLAKRNNGGVVAETFEEVDLRQPLVPIRAGHFAFTLFRSSVFARLSKPWFREQPAPDGGWGDERIDADIGFWHNANQCGVQVMLATQVCIGHGDEVIAWPRVTDGVQETVYQSLAEWHAAKASPPSIGIIQSHVAV